MNVAHRPLLLDLCHMLLIKPSMLRLNEIVDSCPALLDLHLVVCPNRYGIAGPVIAGAPTVAACPRGCVVTISCRTEDFAVTAHASQLGHNQRRSAPHLCMFVFRCQIRI